MSEEIKSVISDLKDLKEHFNEEITLNGFVDNVRNLQYVQLP